MSQDGGQTPGRPAPDIAKQHLMKALVKAIPYVGDTINEVVFETAKEEASARDKERLRDTLKVIRRAQQSQDTDIGDVLVRLETLTDLTQQTQQAILAFAAYLRGNADAATSNKVETALTRTLPGYEPGQAITDEVGVLDSYTLNRAMESGLTPEMLDQIIRDIPGAGNYVRTGGDKTPTIGKLLEWAESVEGPGLNGVFKYIKRRYENFTLNPPAPPR
jgi:hypothetical protein